MLPKSLCPYSLILFISKHNKSSINRLHLTSDIQSRHEVWKIELLISCNWVNVPCLILMFSCTAAFSRVQQHAPWYSNMFPGGQHAPWYSSIHLGTAAFFLVQQHVPWCSNMLSGTATCTLVQQHSPWYNYMLHEATACFLIQKHVPWYHNILPVIASFSWYSNILLF